MLGVWVAERLHTTTSPAARKARNHQLTVYKSTGHAVEDAVAARLVVRRATETGAGVTVEL
ncbi:MAG: hypothetical protein ACRDWI_19490 [Jiangellaceae bacterium]